MGGDEKMVSGEMRNMEISRLQVVHRIDKNGSQKKMGKMGERDGKKKDRGEVSHWTG